MFRRETILSLLALTVAVAPMEGSPADPEPAASTQKVTEVRTAKEIRDRLSKPVTLELGIQPNTSLREALESLSDRQALTILVDNQAFKAEGIEAVEDVPVTLPKIVGIKLSTVLRLILGQVNATYLIRSDHLEITTLRRARPESWMTGEHDLAPTINAEFDKSPLHEALRELAGSSGISVVVDSRVSDKAKTSVTATLNHVPIDTAVLILADMADLTSVALDNVLYVTTKDNAQYLQSQQEKRVNKLGGSETPASAIAAERKSSGKGM